MLMYSVNTRPDMQFAVHQCGKYSHNPRASHAKAVKKICRYLQGTKSRGIRFKKKLLDPMDVRINACADASFCPNWKDEDDKNSSKSRTGCFMQLNDCPVQFASKGQTKTALSTTKSECIALSMAMRDLMWIRRLVNDTSIGFGINHTSNAMHSHMCVQHQN